MIIFTNKRGIFSDKLVLFPNEPEIEALVEDLHFNSLLRIRQTKVNLPDTQKHLVHREIIRTSCVDLTKPIDDIYKGMDPKSCRYEIRKAEKMLDKIEIKENDDAVREDFLNIYNTFVVQKGHARPLSDSEFSQYIPIADIYVIYYDSRPMCGHLILPDNESGRVRLLYSASNRLNSPEDAAIVGPLNRYLHWHEFKKYHSSNYKDYDFGGLSLGGPLATFKKSFGGVATEEYGYVFTGVLTAPIIRASYNTMLWLNGKRTAFTVAMQRRKKLASEKNAV